MGAGACWFTLANPFVENDLLQAHQTLKSGLHWIQLLEENLANATIHHMHELIFLGLLEGKILGVKRCTKKKDTHNGP